MSNVYGFEGYRKRALRQKKLEELYQAVTELEKLSNSPDAGKRYLALGKMFAIASEISKLPSPPQEPA